MGIFTRSRRGNLARCRSASIAGCIIAAAGLALLMCASVLAQRGRASGFAPARLMSWSTPPLPPPNTVGPIEESLEATIDPTGRVRRITSLQSAPGPSLVAPTVSTWRFQLATQSGKAVSSSVFVAAIYRAPQLFNAASGLSPDLGLRSNDIPYPTTTVPPPYPPNAVADGVAIVEILVGEDGRVSEARVVNPAPGFESAALAAARGWSFQPAQRDRQPVPAYAYLVFGFRRPVVASR